MASASAQNTHKRDCGTMEYLESQLKADPGIERRMSAIEDHTQRFIANGGKKSEVVYTIPVVVHVVYNTSAQNISDAQIQSQLTILNNDFRKLNSDWTLTPSVFQGLVADCEINFCLATRDPSGNATTGITRTSTATTSFSSNNNIKYTSLGGKDAWPTGTYLNLWIGNLSGGLLGYAQFPGGATATDGVVCTFTAVGNTGTAAAPFNKGRTATHEVGHWLNLRHIWGDATCGNDLVSDTPTQSTSNGGCPSFPKVTCSNGPNGDMHMNYMDYTDDACMYMFTTGQKARMVAVLAAGGARVSLATSNGCTPPVASCGTPGSLSSANITQTSVTLSWATVTGATGYNVRWKLTSSGTWSSGTVASSPANLTGLTAGSNYEFQVQANCNGTLGSYSASALFTTQSSSTCNTDAYEANNTTGTAKTISTTAISAFICPTGDEDWYAFANLSTAKNIRVTLTNLPADYDIQLYNPSGTLVASSANAGTTSETMIYNNGVIGTYKIRVYGYSGAWHGTTAYSLLASRSSIAYKKTGARLSGEVNPDEETVALNSLSMYPNPASDMVNVIYKSAVKEMVNLTILDQLGKIVKETTISAYEGNNAISVDMNDIKSGLYFLQISNGSSRLVEKLIVNK